MPEQICGRWRSGGFPFSSRGRTLRLEEVPIDEFLSLGTSSADPGSGLGPQLSLRDTVVSYPSMVG